MLALPGTVKLYLAEYPVDFRRGFDGLAAIVENQFGLSPLSGHVFVFLNRRCNQIRLLFWERDGFCLISKRLEAGTFKRQRHGPDGATYLEIDTAELTLLLEGIEVSTVRRSKRYRRQSPDSKPSPEINSDRVH